MKVKILLENDQYYAAAAGRFGWNMRNRPRESGKDSPPDSSVQRFVRNALSHAALYSEAAQLLVNAPIPSGLDPDERIAYVDMVEEKSLMLRDRGLEILEQYLEVAVEAQAPSQHCAVIRDAAREINPGFEGIAQAHGGDSLGVDGGRIDSLYRTSDPVLDSATVPE
jgi:hypothetical protein